MNKFLVFILFISQAFVYSQYRLQGVILDSQNNNPIEFVNVFNDNYHTYSNEDGKFVFESEENSISFKVLGYKEKKETLSNMSANDTIYLEPNVYELEEVIVTDDNPTALKMFKAIPKNYQLEPFQEEFFLRSVLKKNNKIQELQDISGIVERQTLLHTNKSPIIKNNYKFFIEEMRKAGVKDREIDVRTYGLSELFNKFIAIYISPKTFQFIDMVSKDNLTTKISFEAKDTDKTATVGYYIMNNLDDSFGEVYINNSNPNPNPTKKSRIKYQTTHYEVKVWFSKDSLLKKYHIKKARLNLSMEVTIDNGVSDTYNSSFLLHSKPIKYRESITNNVSQKKDLFEIKGKYNNDFWDKQNTLKLSDEMIEFIEYVQETGGKNEYKTITNIKK